MDAPPNDPQLSTWQRADASRPYCTRPWRQVAVLSDGTAVCACVDVLKSNPLGDLKTQSFDEVWNGPAYQRLREAVRADIDSVAVCRGCPNRVAGPPPPEDYDVGVVKPKALFLESAGGCNLVCPGCDRDGIEGSRTELMLDFDAYTRLIDSLAPGLSYMEFHIGGENYLHKRANEMVSYCKHKNPDCFVLSSTNGHFFHNEERCQAVLDSGIDALIISIDGATQETYSRYRVNGRLQRVLEGMQRLARMRSEQGRPGPLLVWRYILFDWNDSREEMQLARELAAEYGADHLAWHLNAVELMQSSKRYYIGSPHLGEIAHELWDTLPGRLGQASPFELATYRDESLA